MEFVDYPGMGPDLASDFQARFSRRDTHVYDSSHLPHPSHFSQAALAGLAVDVKPRLTKEQHDILENEFQKQTKPNTNTKKRFAEILGVSLDKVNNWFQNRRAKSKQDLKKQAGAFNILQASQQPNFAPNTMNPDNISPTYCSSDFFAMRDSAIMDDPMSNGLGISQTGHQGQFLNHDYAMAGQLSNDGLGGFPMQQQHSQHQHSANKDAIEEEVNRRTLTQAQFDVFSNNPPFVQNSNATGMSATITDPSQIYSDFYPDLCDFSFDTGAPDELTSTPMQPSHSNESYASNAATASDTSAVPNFSNANGDQSRNASSATSASPPSVCITPAKQELDPFEYDAPVQPSQTVYAQNSSTASWQPGQSNPIDMMSLQQDFQEAAMRNRTQSVPAIHHVGNASSAFLEQPLAYPADEAFGRRESSTSQLSRSMQNFSMAPQRAAIPSSSIAARRQRPRPSPLPKTSLRSASYCGTLPTSPAPASGNTNIPTGGQSVRRIKSSQAMNGIANGRIQKSVGSAQRSPSNLTFADSTNANRYARRVSSIASLAAASAGLAPPTPLSPSEVSRHELQRAWEQLQASGQTMRHASVSESDSDMMNNVVSSSNFSPPSTPLYATQFTRNRLDSFGVAENTPPQSAPAAQQCFPNGVMTQGIPHIAPPVPPLTILQSQPHGFVPMMANEFPQMPNVVYPNQQQAMSDANQYMGVPMSYIVTNTGEVHMGYPVMPPFAQPQMQQQQATPPHQQHPFMPASSASPSMPLSSKHATPAADFFVHEYEPPQEVKQSATPRKAVDAGPKNYTFSNHGPEYFEKNAKKGGLSPASSAGDASSS